MGLVAKEKIRNIAVGKGIECPKYYVQGQGILDGPTTLIQSFLPFIKTIGENKDLAANIGKSAVDIFTIAKNTKELIGKSKRKPTTADEVVKAIKGKGFKFIK